MQSINILNQAWNDVVRRAILFRRLPITSEQNLPFNFSQTDLRGKEILYGREILGLRYLCYKRDARDERTTFTKWICASACVASSPSAQSAVILLLVLHFRIGIDRRVSVWSAFLYLLSVHGYFATESYSSFPSACPLCSFSFHPSRSILRPWCGSLSGTRFLFRDNIFYLVYS